MYCVNLSETSHTHRSAINACLKIRLYEIIVCSCIIYDFSFLNIAEIIFASSTIHYGLWLHLDDRYCAFDQRLIPS